VAVHYGGIGCEMTEIAEIASARGIPVIEDNAHGLFGRYRGQSLGTLGMLAIQSFHETKNVSCGEGGALLLNDPGHIQRAEVIREKGTNRKRFFRGHVDRYTWVDVGSSFVPSEILAAWLYAQLESSARIQETRCRLWYRYQSELEQWAQKTGVRLPIVPRHCQQPFHMFYLLLPELRARQALMAHLRALGIMAVFHYQPLHTSEMGRRFGGRQGDCPVTEDVADRLLRLPLFFQLTEDEQSRVLDAVVSWR
jgi:dTDP-4-amino-4,6-dideoxygalactose transaminase